MRQSKKEVDDLSYQIIGAAIEVHRNIGPGFLESVYQKCFAIELDERKLTFQQELELPFSYKNHTIVGHFRCDFFC